MDEITWLSYRLSSGTKLEYNMCKGCRCGGCSEFQLLELDDNFEWEVVCQSESLTELIKLGMARDQKLGRQY